MRTEIAILYERLDSFISQTERYRKELCTKIDLITTRLNCLPCKENAEKHKWHDRNIVALWGFVGAIIMLIFSKMW